MLGSSASEMGKRKFFSNFLIRNFAFLILLTQATLNQDFSSAGWISDHVDPQTIHLAIEIKT